MGYIQELRKYLGTKPLILTGSTIIVLNNKNEVLLQKRIDTGDWGIPGGSLELGESFEEAAHRELYEETGLKIKSLKLVTVLSGKEMYFKYPHGDEVYNAIVVYETRDYEGKLSINDGESTELKFFPLEEPIRNINIMAEKILKKSGYIKKY